MTVTTLPTAHVQAPAAPTGGALAIRPDQTMWTPEQAAVLRQSGINEGVTAEELSAFLHLCQRTQLDPFSRQIYLIGRWDNREQRKVYTPQTSIDGYRVIAHRAAAKAGHTLGYEDTLWCDASGRWRDVWLTDAPPAAAKVTVLRNGQRFSAVARYAEYVQTTKKGGLSGLWGKMAATMTAKCAEALALRMAFPHDLAGVYTAEEMAQADSGAQEPETAPQVHRVQQPQHDQWSTPAPAPVRDWIAEAQAAPDAEAVRRLYEEAGQAGAPVEIGRQIAEIGRTKPGARQPQAPAEEPNRGAIADMPRRAMEWTNSVPDPVTVEDITDAAGEASWQGEPAKQAAYSVSAEADASRDHTARAAADAEQALRLAASHANLRDLDDAFARVYGLPIEQAPVHQIDAFRQQIEAASQGGAR
jgi:phage recombination protein Bet